LMMTFFFLLSTCLVALSRLSITMWVWQGWGKKGGSQLFDRI
jgi:hypothetical protein